MDPTHGVAEAMAAKWLGAAYGPASDRPVGWAASAPELRIQQVGDRSEELAGL
jgi:hypothetical protein